VVAVGVSTPDGQWTVLVAQSLDEVNDGTEAATAALLVGLPLLTIVVGSVVAYLVNDSGAAAVGEGLTTSLAGMLYVSLRLGDDMMTT